MGIGILSLFALVSLVTATEVLHANPETASIHCNKLTDIIDDDNPALFDELLSCELTESLECKNT
jgi:hypothetical protein